MKMLLLNNIKVIGIFVGSLIILFIIMWILWGLDETNLISHRVYDIVLFFMSLTLLVLHYYSGRKFLISSGNMGTDLLSFILIITIVAIYIQRTPSGIISNHYNVFLTHYGFLNPVFDDHIARIGVGVIISCTAQYLGMLSEVKG